MSQLSSFDLTWTLEDQQLMTRAKNYFAWQRRLVLPELGQRVLEIGCGIGNFTGHLLNREAVIAIDTEPHFIDRIKARYPNQPNLIALVHDAATGLSALRHYTPDSCVCLNVLEHIEDDRQALRDMASAITPGGAIVLIVPAFPSLSGPIDRKLGHFRRYTRQSLTQTATDAGLSVRKLQYMNMPGFFAWWLNARILHLEAQSAAQIELFDTLIVPLAARIEKLTPPPFGQSLFCVLV